MGQGLVRYPGAGCVVEFMQGNALQIAWVLEEQGGRLRLLLPNRRETALQAARLLPWAGPTHEGVTSRDKALELLVQHKTRRDALVLSFNMLELWELSQGEVERAPASWFADIVITSPDADAVAACGHALMECKSHFRFQPPDFEVLSEDVVNARLKEQEVAQKREALLNQGSVFLRQLWENWSKGKPTPAGLDEHLDEAIARRLKKALMARIADPDTPDDEALWKQLVKGLPEEALPLYLAQAWGIVKPHHNFWLDRAGYDPGNDWAAPYDAALADLETKVRQTLAELPDEPLPFISIDSSTTRDIDDAFHVRERSAEEGGGWVLTLALACPALNWPFGSDLDKAVAQRATSLYVPEKTHHMLPELLGTDAYSLLAGQARPALLVECEVLADGSVSRCSPRLGRVKLAANLCYEACEDVLNGQSADSTALNPDLEPDESSSTESFYAKPLRMGLALAQTRLAYRLANGAVIIQRPDLHFVLEGEGEDIKVTMEDETPAPLAHLLVAEHMLLANAALACWAGENGISLLFRTQNVTIPKEFAGIWTDPVDIARVVRVLAPACLETVPRPHAGVGEAAYAPSTSPLRRYPDLLNEAQILHQFTHGAPRWSKEDLDGMLVALNARLDAAGQVQRQRPRYWKLVCLRQQGDVWRSAVITDETDMFVTVNLPKEQLVLRARRHLFGERTMPGQPVEVRLGKIRPVQGEVSLVEVREL